MPHILIINHEFPPTGGGAATASAHLAREMAAMGAKVTVVTSAFGNLPRRHTADGVRIVRIPALRKYKDKSNILEFCSFLLSSLVWALCSRGQEAHTKFDLCIAFFGLPAGPAAWLLRVLYHIPYIISLRGGDVPGFLPVQLAHWHRLTGWLLHFLWRGALHVVGNSSGLSQLAMRSAPHIPVLTIPNGVDCQRFAPAQEQRQEDTTQAEICHFLFTGRLNVQKNLPCLLQALHGLRHLPWRLTLAGDGPEREALTALAQELGLRDRISMPGWIAREKLAHVLQDADVYVFPSIQEGMPNTVLEAMACGLPIIACRIEGCEELVVHGENGLLLPPDDVQALREAMATLATQNALRKDMGRKSRTRVEEHYTWQSTARQYLALCPTGVEGKA